MKKKKLLSVLLIMAMTAGLATGCGSSSSSEGESSDAEGQVYYLNFKPEADEYWQELAEIYTEETGVPVTVLTAASGEYEKTLKSEMAKTDAPTLFQVNGPVGLASWKDYCYDLSGSDIAGELTDDSFALMDGDKMAGIAYVIENYGIIYNKALLEKAGYTAEDITDFDSFKKVVGDITARKDELGFSAFTSAGMDSSSDWRFKTHLANLPTTMSIRLTASTTQTPSREPILTITVRSGICISTMQPVSLQRSLRRQPTMRPQSL